MKQYYVWDLLKDNKKGNGRGARETRSRAVGSSGVERGRGCARGCIALSCAWAGTLHGGRIMMTCSLVCVTLSLVEVCALHSGFEGAFLSLTRSLGRPNDQIQQVEMQRVCSGLLGQIQALPLPAGLGDGLRCWTVMLFLGQFCKNPVLHAALEAPKAQTKSIAPAKTS